MCVRGRLGSGRNQLSGRCIYPLTLPELCLLRALSICFLPPEAMDCVLLFSKCSPHPGLIRNAHFPSWFTSKRPPAILKPVYHHYCELQASLSKYQIIINKNKTERQSSPFPHPILPTSGHLNDTNGTHGSGWGHLHLVSETGKLLEMDSAWKFSTDHTLPCCLHTILSVS